jgi:GAF domain-containing protein
MDDVSTRAVRLSAAFVKLADTLVADFDVLDLLQTLIDESVGILDAAAAGLLLTDDDGVPHVVASTSEESRLVALMQQEDGAGPCIDCYTHGIAVTVEDLAAARDQWPAFTEAALFQGFHSVHAVPLRLNGRILGAMTLFRTSTGRLTNEDIHIGQALADVAAISLLHEHNVRETHLLNKQLQKAMADRILIEQAKGVIAHLANTTIEDAFSQLREYARINQMSLREAAYKTVTGRTNP